MKTWPNAWAPKPNVSFSSAKRFDACRWRYLLSANWEEVRDHLPVQQIIEAGLTPWAAFAGQVVDCTITEALRHYYGHRTWPEDLEKRATDKLSEAWKATMRWSADGRRGKKSPFGSNMIDRVYYEGTTIPAGDIREVKALVKLCIQNFEQSDLRDFLTSYDVQHWSFARVQPDTPIPWFWSDGVPIYASYDFAIRAPGVMIILDWKCGRRNLRSEQAAREQLHAYAEFARVAWEADLGAISVIPVWLAESPARWTPEPLDESYIEGLREQWRLRYDDLCTRLRELSRDPQKARLQFPMAESAWTCKWCGIHSCEGYKRVAALPSIVRETDPDDPFEDL
jgi:hypothetical protein